MIKQSLTAVLLCSFVFLSSCLSAQKNQQSPFYSEIENFKKSDSAVMPPEGKILMIGSSSFTLWQDVTRYMPGYPFINRGFGGSTLAHLIMYFDEIVTPYKPRQVLIYCGENDIAEKASPDLVVKRFKTLFQMLREQNPDAKITYVSMKPSASRLNLMGKMKEGNDRIKEFLSTEKNTSFVNVFSKMLDSSGAPLPEIFKEDSLHLDGRGYELWAKEIAPHLLKN